MPGSGGKDSAFVAHQLKTRYGMHPLVVSRGRPSIGRRSAGRTSEAFVGSGFNNVVAMPDGVLHRQLARTAFEAKGDAFEPFVYGQKAWAYHVAQRFGVQLIMYGENGEFEYGGRRAIATCRRRRPSEWAYAYFKGASVDQLVEHGYVERVLIRPEAGHAIGDAVVQASQPRGRSPSSGSRCIGIRYYEKWTPQENYYYAVTHTGFEPNDEGRTEGTYTKYASLDDRADGFHFYLAYMKFGLGVRHATPSRTSAGTTSLVKKA